MQPSLSSPRRLSGPSAHFDVGVAPLWFSDTTPFWLRQPRSLRDQSLARPTEEAARAEEDLNISKDHVGGALWALYCRSKKDDGWEAAYGLVSRHRVVGSRTSLID